MKRIAIMMYPEVLDSLEELTNEEIGIMIRLICKWNKGEEVKPNGSLEKYVWSTIHPKLESNKESYQNIIDRNRVNGKKGGRPKTQDNPMGFSGNPNNPNYNSNSNSNYINSSKEELINTPQPSSSEDESVVSKGLETLEKTFPQGRNKIGIDEINTWNSLSQQDKQSMIKRAKLYIREENKNNDGKFIKGIGKWMKEQIEKGLESTSTKSTNSTNNDDLRLLKHVDGTIYNAILEACNNVNRTAEIVYSRLNRKDEFKTKNEFYSYVKGITKDEVDEILTWK
jgi:hypothetical protein